VKNYVCKDWSEVPSYLKTKTSLNQMGIFSLSKPVAIVEIYGREYKLYNLYTCLKNEQNKGNKNLKINKETKDHYLIAEVKTTGRSENDRITELFIMDMDGKVLFFKEFKSDKDWDKNWDRIELLIKDKILFIPNTLYFKRIMKQSCERCGIEVNFEINTICSDNHIKHKVSFFDILKKKEPEVIQRDLKKSCYQLLETIYPNSIIFYYRRKSLVYFNKLCEYKMKQGDMNGLEKGRQWLIRDYGSTKFSEFSYEVSKEIIDLIYPILKGLGCLPRKF